METRFQELQRYVRLSSEDAGLLASFLPVAAPHFERIAQEFYDRIREHEEAHAVFTGEDQIKRLQRSLVAWLKRLLSGTYDEAYFAETEKIGRVHVKVGLPQRYMFTAMALIRVSLTRIAQVEMGAAGPSVSEAVTRLIDLELATMLESYRANSLERIRRRDEIEKDELNRALAHTEHTYVNAVELARVLIIGVDGKGIIRLFNREAERVTAFAREEVIGAPFIETLLTDEMLASHGARVRELIAGKRPAGDIRLGEVKTRSGNIRSVHWQLAFAPAPQDDEVVMFAIGHDTTDENRALERARQHEKLAAVGTLAAGLAHEIRNPLNGAQLHVAFLERSLKRTGSNGELLEAVGVVGDEIRRLADLVTEFLEFARPMPLQVKPTILQELCRRCQQLVTPQAKEAHVELAFDLPAQDLVVPADAPRLEQVLLNLLQNGVEALAPSGGLVTLRARRRPRHAVLEVEDNGPGLASPTAPIFDAFFSTKVAGTGLGLAIVHRIVTDHAGTIEVESRPGRTCFRVTLPIEPPDVSKSAP